MKQDQLLSLAWQIVDRLSLSGHQAYLVGGFVRDRLLGKAIKDIDIATSARPESVMSLFERALPTGLQHGTVTVVMEGAPFEVTTFRSETGYSDHRRPDEVVFIEDIREDLSRRDFTMNAMALDRDSKLIDPFGGERDLREKRLRCVGEPQRRFEEDALRMLRCIRFAAEYGLSIEPATWEALCRQADTIRDIAIERVRAELERIVEGSSPLRGLKLLVESGLGKAFKVPLRADINELESLEPLEGEPVTRWALLLGKSGYSSSEAAGLLRKLTFPNVKISHVVNLLQFDEGMQAYEHSAAAEKQREFKLLTLQYGKESAVRWLEAHPIHRTNGMMWLTEMPIAEAADLAVSGEDLLSLGYAAGPGLGAMLRELLRKVALGEVDNQKEPLLAAAKAALTEEV